MRVDELFGTEFASDKAHGLEYNDSRSNHAMTLTGVNLDKAGEPDRWKVENSWGKDNGKDGYYVASGACSTAMFRSSSSARNTWTSARSPRWIPNR